MSEPHWHPEAIVEAEEAQNWYAERSPLAARGFLLALEESIAAVMEAPERWPLGKHGCRQYVFPNRYPYNLVYRLTSRLSLWHTRSAIPAIGRNDRLDAAEPATPEIFSLALQARVSSRRCGPDRPDGYSRRS
ncbi:type II toxin-antitoxin system RelE/ParE family toxin [Acidobacteria bacterium AH-259-D05]|nr:type II toxin-antitoxin system RelE/ParE family toxin [Acidobacteria bacterium AH-259-D05]